MREVTIYTDGACSGNPGPGGWCAILIYMEHEKQVTGFEHETTNNRMELKAAAEALKMLKETCSVRLHSDSSYLVNAFNEKWIDRWTKNDWKKADKAPVKNIDLWKELYELAKKHEITWIKVAGHSDDKYNNRCDKAAVEQITLMTREKENV